MNPEVFLIVGFVGFIGLIAILLIIKNLLYICEPNEVLIFSGDRKPTLDGVVGYRLIQGGRAVRKPLVERVDRLELTNMVIPLAIRNAYSKGGIALNIEAVANVKIASVEPIIHNAIERLLGKSRAQIMQLAKETLEGNLRGVLATLTPEEVNEDKTAFQKSLVGEAEQDLEKLGLKLDTLNIQNISDDKGYLDSIGRKQSAEVLKKAMIAEARSKAEASIRSAQNSRDISLAKIEAETQTAKASADRRIIDAQTRRAAVVAEQRSEITAQIAKASAEVNVQKARIEQVRRKLEADVIEPARAGMQAAIAEAIGRSSKILEEGKASAEALRAVTETWTKSGDHARDIFLLQKIDLLMKQVLETVHDVHIHQITLLPGASSQSSPLASKLVSTSEQLKAALGVDIPQILQRFQS